MSEHNFDTKNCQNADLPPFLKQKQKDTQKDQNTSNLDFNKTIHVDTFQKDDLPVKAIITITNESTAYSVSSIIGIDNANSLVEVLKTQWFDKYGFPKTILLKQGKVQVSKLEGKINKMTPLETMVTCKSQMTTFNTETEQQWKQNLHQLSGDDFVNTINFFHNIRKPELGGRSNKYTTRKPNGDNRDQSQENKDEAQDDFEEVNNLSSNHQACHSRRKAIELCRHKLQWRMVCNHKNGRKRFQPREEYWSSG